MNKNEVKDIFYKILKGVAFIHQSNYSHGDIKLENVIIFNNNLIKLIDFGFSNNCMFNNFIERFWGTPQYMAPEIINKVKYNSKKSDVWALGILLYKLLTGKYLFHGDNNEEIYQKIKNWNNNFDKYKSSDIDRELQRDFLNKCIRVNPDERENCKNLLAHDWFTNN